MEDQKQNDLVYVVEQVQKYSIGTGSSHPDFKKNTFEAIQMLWACRENDQYLAYHGGNSFKLKELIGESEREIVSENAKKHNVQIPETDDFIPHGLLTDIVNAARQKALRLPKVVCSDDEGIEYCKSHPEAYRLKRTFPDKTGHFEKFFNIYTIDGEEERKRADSVTHGLYVIGSVLPHIIEGTVHEEQLKVITRPDSYTGSMSLSRIPILQDPISSASELVKRFSSERYERFQKAIKG